MTNKIFISINKKIINKIDANNKAQWEQFATSFENVELTTEELADQINQGFSVCAQHNARRSNANFTRTNALFVDIDDGLTLEEALSMPFVQDRATLIYTTPTHTPQHHRFRIMFQLERMIEDAEEMRCALGGLISRFGGDEACKDACRGYFGSKGCDPIIIGKHLHNGLLISLIAKGKLKLTKKNKKVVSGDMQTQMSKSNASTSAFFLDDNHLLQTAGNNTSISLDKAIKGQTVRCPFHFDQNPSAFITVNKNGVKGVHCHACRQSFWPKSQEYIKYNFHSYEQFLQTRLYGMTLPAGVQANAVLRDMIPNIANYEVFNSQYINKTIPLHDGVTFMRSPKGSGKTEWLSKIVNACRKKNKKILLIGHRRSLIQGIAKRLGITCYINTEGSKTKYIKPTNEYAVCVDSVAKMLDLKEHKFDVVIIDESEQVFAHATSRTVKDKRRVTCEKIFHYLRRAKSIILADADLDLITTSAIWNIVGDKKTYNLYLNEYKEQGREILNFNSSAYLVQDLVNSVNSGGRYFVATNSKYEANVLYSLLKRKNRSKKILLVTSDTTSESAVRKLLSNVVSEIINYDVVITTPTMGTGIDITFANKAKLIDGVYGFFVCGVNSHFDIDQQLCRVRHPGFIKVSVSNFPLMEETTIDVISSEMKNSEHINDIILGYREDCEPIVDQNYLNLYCAVTSVDRASKNQLHKNFIELRKNNGWTIQDVICPLHAADDINEELIEIRMVMQALKTKKISNAAQITDAEYISLLNEGKNRKITTEEESSMRNAELRMFYKTKVTEALIALDDNAKYREKVKLLESYLEDFAHVKNHGKSERGRLLPDRDLFATKQMALYHLLKSAGIAQGNTKIDINCTVTQNSLGDFADLFKENFSQLARLFGFEKCPSDIEEKTMSTLNRVLSLIGLRLTHTRSKTKAGTIYTYTMDIDAWNRINSIVERRLKSKARARLKNQKQEPDKNKYQDVRELLNCPEKEQPIEIAIERDVITEFKRGLIKRQPSKGTSKGLQLLYGIFKSAPAPKKQDSRASTFLKF